MVLPISLLLCLVVSILPSPSLAAEGPSCQLLNLPSPSNSYDLSPLSDLQLIEDTKKTPPTETTSRVRFKLCGGEGDGIGKEEGVDDEDQVRFITSLSSFLLRRSELSLHILDRKLPPLISSSHPS